MKKRVFGRKLGRDFGSRVALFRSLVKSLVKEGKIVTTKAKAKAALPLVEKLVKLSKNKDVSSIRRVYAYLANDKSALGILVNKVAAAFSGRDGGFVRIVNLPRRRGDSAEMVRMEWTETIDVSVGDKQQKTSRTSGLKEDSKQAGRSRNKKTSEAKDTKPKKDAKK
jgi:large subunit ribosomal protein L17